jgi:hypothetical protein
MIRWKRGYAHPGKAVSITPNCRIRAMRIVAATQHLSKIAPLEPDNRQADRSRQAYDS